MEASRSLAGLLHCFIRLFHIGVSDKHRFKVESTEQVSVRSGPLAKSWSKLGVLIMDEAASSQSPNESYYQLSPFGFLGDSYFTQPQYDCQQYGSQQLGLGIEYPGGVDYTALNSPSSVSTSYQSYQSRDPMDPNLLSAENYQEGAYERTNLGRGGTGSTQLLMGSLAGNPCTPSPPASDTETRTTSKKDASKGAAAEYKSTRQRGRPRLDTRDQSAAEVCFRDIRPLPQFIMVVLQPCNYSCASLWISSSRRGV